MIRIDGIWLATEPLDMRAGADTALARVVLVFGSARPHCDYLFANKRANRMKVLVHDGLGIWLCARPSPPTGRVSVPAPFWVTGKASWCVTITPATRPASAKASSMIGCIAHPRRKFYDLHVANQSVLAEQALEYIKLLYQIGQEAKDLAQQQRQIMKAIQAKPIAETLHKWMLTQR